MRILGSLPNGNVIDKHNSLRFIVSDGDVVQGKYSLSFFSPSLSLSVSVSLLSVPPSLLLFLSSFPFTSFHIIIFILQLLILLSV